MCGRFIQKSERRIISEEFYINRFLDDVVVSYNLAPGQQAGVILKTGGENCYAQYRWGLVPSWAKDPEIGNRMINARAETLTQKPSYKTAFYKRRCLIPADGFYEWKKDGNFKTPYLIHFVSEKPFSLAGLWEAWKDSEGKELRTFTIITTEANRKLKTLHERMPVIITQEERDLWLAAGAEQEKELLALLAPDDIPEIEFYEVSRMVNSPQNNSPECILPV